MDSHTYRGPHAQIVNIDWGNETSGYHEYLRSTNAVDPTAVLRVLRQPTFQAQALAEIRLGSHLPRVNKHSFHPARICMESNEHVLRWESPSIKLIMLTKNADFISPSGNDLPPVACVCGYERARFRSARTLKADDLARSSVVMWPVGDFDVSLPSQDGVPTCPHASQPDLRFKLCCSLKVM